MTAMKQIVLLYLLAELSLASPAVYGVSLSLLNLTRTDVAASVPHSPAAETSSSSKEKDCQDQIGKIENDEVINTMPKYDIAKILEQYGGPAGQLNVTWNKDVPETFEDPQLTSPPHVPDTKNNTYWMYDYRHSDFQTFIRMEHALLRRKGQPDEHTDVRGEIYWTPPDFCGRMRRADYRLDPAGFSATVSLEYCDIGDDSVWCATPADCHSNSTHNYCVG